MQGVERAKLNAAKAVLGEIEGCSVVGVGTGSTVEKLIELLGGLEGYRGKLYVASSIDTALKLSRAGLRVLDASFAPEVEVYVDGADEVDARLSMIKGGGAAATMEKILAHYARRRVFIVDYTKLVDRLGERHPVPIEVLPQALGPVLRRLAEWGFKAEPRYPGRGKMGPVVADTGGVVVDVYTGPIENPEELNLRLRSLPGVVETGLFIGYADAVYVGYPDRVEVREKGGGITRVIPV
ncbi:MAG: ribose-5-phosphate isomerase RpiA [Thermofilaceae archaeon]